ncbi:MAG: hypothetical protein ACYTDY_10330 [Planctomycetota bacterium]|jgi:hypothetical protein
MRRSLPTTLGLVLLASCAVTCSTTRDPSVPPDWIENIPLESEYVYAVGSYHGALYREDNRKHAVKDARGALAQNLKARIRSTSKQKDFTSSGRTSTETRVDTDYVVKNSEEVASWTDIVGRISTRGTVWILMRVRRLP